MHPPDRIYLASRSPRRRELLSQIGVHFELLMFRAAPREDPEVDEGEHPGEPPEAYVRRIALAKVRHAHALIVKRHLPPRLVLSADTTLDLDGRVIGKPSDPLDAERILGTLSARTHRVLTAVAVSDGTRVAETLSISEVRFRALEAEEIRRYVRSGEPLDKAGAYALQGRAAMFVAAVRGSPSGIVGLPLCDTAGLLKDFGFPL